MPGRWQEHVRREPEAEADQRGGDGVGEVVEVVAVGRPLGLADARERPVERVAEPVHDEQRLAVRRPRYAAATANAPAAARARAVRVVGHHHAGSCRAIASSSFCSGRASRNASSRGGGAHVPLLLTIGQHSVFY